MPNIILPLSGEANWGPKINTAITVVNAAVDALPNSVTAYSGTSVTSLAVTVSSKVFATQAGKSWTVGQRVRAASVTTPTTYVEGVITDYSTTNLTVNVDGVAGTGTFASWSLNLTGNPGAIGAPALTYGIYPRIRYTGTVWPTIAATYPLLLVAQNYEWDSRGYNAAPSPPERKNLDDWWRSL